ncbi:MAG: hypothetical protein ABI743_00515 [bacterium]
MVSALAVLAVASITRAPAEGVTPIDPVLRDWTPGCPVVNDVAWQSTLSHYVGGGQADTSFVIPVGDRILRTDYDFDQTNGGLNSTTLLDPDRPELKAIYNGEEIHTWPTADTLYVLAQAGCTGHGRIEARDPETLALTGSWTLPIPADQGGFTFAGACWQMQTQFADGSLGLMAMGTATATENVKRRLSWALQRFDPATGIATPGVLLDVITDLDWKTVPVDGHAVLGVVRNNAGLPADGIVRTLPGLFVQVDWDTAAVTLANMNDPRARAFGAEAPALPHLDMVSDLAENSYGVERIHAAIYGEHPMSLGGDYMQLRDGVLDPEAYNVPMTSLVSLTPYLQHPGAEAPNRTIAGQMQWSFRDGDQAVVAPVPAELDSTIRATFAAADRFPVALFALDAEHVMILQLVAPIPEATDPLARSGVMRYGLITPPVAAVEWTGAIPLPAEYADAPKNPYLVAFAGPNTLQLRFQSFAAQHESQPGDPVALASAIAVPWPASWPHAPVGLLRDRVLPSE